MPKHEDFFIDYKSDRVRVTPVINGGNIYFIIRFKTPVAIAEGMINESWVWYEVDKGQKVLSAELGEIIEGFDI